ncbi:hypothetical protein EJ06DRAFT_529340 [Trichodelitschia bisporula]|uniref:Uncharacterized protein n=1 Tax=Trichodelitschia bisporula TaxID=703511 RepID=A0A6G1HYT4_9PEZI|nr:hypothetical protein EJ06DRAFT_529340 [Trichodelitschia bisporula]
MLLNDKLVCDSRPTYTKQAVPGAPAGAPVAETITEMSWCLEPVKFKKGDKVKLLTIYDTLKHPL